MERDELEGYLHDLGFTMRDVQYAKEHNDKVELKILEVKLKTILDHLSGARCHIAMFEKRCYRRNDGTRWKRKYELPNYCTGDAVYYAALPISLVVDGTTKHAPLAKG